MKTLFVGQNSIHVESVDSTNSYATEMLRQIDLSEGSLIYSFDQKKGRGQRGNFWESEPNKNVALSLVLYPRFLTAEKQFLLTKITSLAVADLMAEILGNSQSVLKINIKWPNDIYVNGKKIAGILIENALRETFIQSSIVGIGINVNQREYRTTANATSICLFLNEEIMLTEVLERFCEFFEARYLQLKAEKFNSIDDAYIEQLFRINEWSEYRSKASNFEGKIIGVSAIGKLKVETKANGIREFDLKEIEFI